MEQELSENYEQRYLEAVVRIANAKQNEQKSLSLVGLGLKELPVQLFELQNLRELHIGKNQLTYFPDEFANLENLTSLHAQQCQITEFPYVFLKLRNLKILNLGKNKIRAIPDNISDLTNLNNLSLSRNEIDNLPSSISQLENLGVLELTGNNIHSIPQELVNLKNLRRITLRGNPIRFPHSKSIKGIPSEQNALFQILHHFINENISNNNENVNHIQLPESLRTAFQQYLVFFNDFVYKAKGLEINIKVSQYNDGLEIIYSKAIDINLMQQYLDEYIGFIKEGVDKINPEFDSRATQDSKEILIVELKNQVRHLTSQIEIKQVENKLLFKQVDMIHEALIASQGKQSIIVNANSNALSQSSSHIQIDFKTEMEELQNIFLQFKNEIKPYLSESSISELELIDKNLLEIDSDENSLEKIEKVPFKRLKRLIDQINDNDSEWNKIISATKKGVSYLQKIGKHYNKIAPWLGIPNVPDQLL